MTVAVLPFNAGPNTRPTLARQLAAYVAEIVRVRTGAEVNSVNYLVRLDESPNPRLANVNASEELNELDMVKQLFDQTEAGGAVDGLLVEKSDTEFELTARFFKKGESEPSETDTIVITPLTVLAEVRKLIIKVAGLAEQTIEDQPDEEFFGTKHGLAFLKFLEGFDAPTYIDKTQGMVAEEFSPEHSFQVLGEAAKLDKDWEAPYIAMLQLSRMCVNGRIGTADMVEAALKDLIEDFPQDERAHVVLGELYSAIGNHDAAANILEKAIQINDKEPALMTRLGIEQMNMGMPVNAERNFRKALELEGDDKPTMDWLANVLQNTNRAHEVPALWKEMIASNPKEGSFRVKLAQAQLAAGEEDNAAKTFEEALEAVEENTIVKRFYAPILAQKGDLDRAMDFYEDCLDEVPNDVQVNLEYGQTLMAAGRQFEVPPVLKNVLNMNPDPNTRAQVLAWQLELEQPKRVESIAVAQQKMEAEDFQGALRDLRPMKNWLGDYWKMWALLAACLNRIGEFTEAEEAATRLLNMYPGCEPAYAELATALGNQGRDEEAYNAMRFGMQQVQNSLPIILNLGLAAKRTGRMEEARDIARQLRSALGNSNPELDPVLDEMEKEDPA